jgi:hypothetical protein
VRAVPSGQPLEEKEGQMFRTFLAALLVAAAALVFALPAAAATRPPVQVLSHTSVVGKGDLATLLARAPSGARCQLVIYLRSGPSAANGLGLKRAVNGRVSWTWTVARNTTGGTYPIYVECGPTAIAKTTFRIV